MAVASFKAQFNLTGSPVTVTGESMSETSTTNLYEIDDSAKDVWDPRAAITVYEDGSPVSLSNVTVYYLLGQVDFDSAPTEPVTVDVDYFPTYQIADANSFSAELGPTVHDTNQLTDKGNNRIQARDDCTVSFSQFDFGGKHIDAPTNSENRVLDFVRDRDIVVCEMIQDFEATNSPTIRSIGYITSDDVTIPQSGVVEGDFQFESSQFDINSNNVDPHHNWRYKT